MERSDSEQSDSEQLYIRAVIWTGVDIRISGGVLEQDIVCSGK